MKNLQFCLFALLSYQQDHVESYTIPHIKFVEQQTLKVNAQSKCLKYRFVHHLRIAANCIISNYYKNVIHRWHTSDGHTSQLTNSWLGMTG